MPGLVLPDPPLRDGEVMLRPWRESDVPAITIACQDVLVARFVPHVPQPYDEQDALDWLATHEPARATGSGLELAIVDEPSDGVYGAIAAAIHQREKSASLGYWLTAAARGHGRATRALRLLCGWLFDAAGLQRLALTTDPQNLASQRVAARCGFQQEGRLRSHLLFVSTGERRDSLLWSLLPGELT